MNLSNIMAVKKYLKSTLRIKIALCLFIILILASIFGTVAPIDIYHSWWFITILVLLAINIVICSLSRKNRLAYYLVHLSILLILLGAIIGATVGFKEYFEVFEGQTVDVPKADFQIKLEDFDIKYYPHSQMPEDYKSTLTIIEKGKAVLTKTIEVNHPLAYKGIRFYQSSYGIDRVKAVILNVRKDSNEQGENLTIGVGKEVIIPKLGLRIKLTHFLPDFMMIGTKTYSRSNELNNPAARLEVASLSEVADKECLTYIQWVFAKFPDFHSEASSGLKFKLIGFDTSYYSGIQVVKDPGVPVVFLGFGLLMIGLIIFFGRR